MTAYEKALSLAPAGSAEWEEAAVGACRAEGSQAYLTYRRPPGARQGDKERRAHQRAAGYACLLRHRAPMSAHLKIYGQATLAGVLKDALPPGNPQSNATMLRGYADVFSGADQQALLETFPRDRFVCLDLMEGSDRERWSLPCVRSIAAQIRSLKQVERLKAETRNFAEVCEKAAGLDAVEKACVDEASRIIAHVASVQPGQDVVGHCAWVQRLPQVLLAPDAMETCFQPRSQKQLASLDGIARNLDEKKEAVAWFSHWRDLNRTCLATKWLPAVEARCKELKERHAARAVEVERVVARVNAEAEAAKRAEEAQDADRYTRVAVGLGVGRRHAAHVFERLAQALGGGPASEAGLDSDDSVPVLFEFSRVPKECESLAHAFGWRPGQQKPPVAGSGWAVTLELTGCRFEAAGLGCSTTETVVRGGTYRVDQKDWKGDRIVGTARNPDTVVRTERCSDTIVADVQAFGTLHFQHGGSRWSQPLKLSEFPKVHSSGREVAVEQGVWRLRGLIDRERARRKRPSAPLLQKARAAEKAGDLAEALEYYERARRAGGGDADLRRLLEKGYEVPAGHVGRAFPPAS